MKGKLLTLSVLVLIVGMLLAACAPAAPATTPTSVPATPPSKSAVPTPAASVPATSLGRNIKVGIVDTYSGPPAAFGNEALKGFELALKEINKTGVLGAKIEYAKRDEKFAPDVALSMAKELVLQEKVDVLVGTINSASSLAISGYAKEQKVPFIVWTAKSEKITGANGHRYVFSTSENTAMAGKAGAQGLAKKPYVKYWIAGDDYEYGHALAESAWNNLKKLKPDVQLLGQTWWKTGEPDLAPFLTQIMAAKPDAVILATGGAGMTNALKAAKSTGMSDRIPIWIHTATDYSVLKPLGANAPEGVMGTMDYHFYYPDTPDNKAFVKAFQDAYGTPPGFPAYHAYNTAYFIADAFKKAGSLDKEKFIDALEGLKIKSPTGEVEMRACDHQAVLPMYLGVTKKTSQYDFPIATDIVALQGKDIMPSCDDIKKARGQ
ncbi:MAG: ABC transporter substrate-binding protein [Chloroflexi bacterium]|nr:ABC transporter substrate-binding protein [Chloroflexota bacterium]MDA8188885.1 ABC transporter substrate-binding protein [Dehalococcoidales bacterium]